MITATVEILSQDAGTSIDPGDFNVELQRASEAIGDAARVVRIGYQGGTRPRRLATGRVYVTAATEGKAEIARQRVQAAMLHHYPTDAIVRIKR